jgi:hypothetical protein
MISGGTGEIGVFGSRLEILNVGDGDTKLSFDPKNPAERERAAKIVGEMLRMGFAVMVEVDVKGEKLFRRVHDFDPETCEYIIFGGPDEQSSETASAAPAEADAPKPKKPKRGRPSGQRYAATNVRAIGVSRSAGG